MPVSARLRRLAATSLALGLLVAPLAACNTAGGAGQDISSAGHDVTRAATSVQTDIHRSTGAATQ